MRWYFDYISPYAYLQSTRLPELEQTQPVTCTPVLFAGLLKHWENVGPAEIQPKRQWTFREVVWLANRDNIELQLPPHHPFNPLPLLRLGIVHNNETAIVQRLFRYVWAEGKLPQDEASFTDLLNELNTKESELQSSSIKAELQANGDLAINNGVFGVPTIEIGTDRFWGYNATQMALDSVNSARDYPSASLKAADALPEGTVRKRKSDHTRRATPRLPLKPIDLSEPADLVSAIRKRRGGELIELDRLLLYSAPLAEGWNHYIGNIRNHFSIDQKLRELAMCTVAVINHAEYEYTQHAPLYIKAGGTQEKAQLIRKPDAAQTHDSFSLEEQLTIALTTQLTRDVQIEQPLFDHALQVLGDEHLVELIATIAAYNMVSRFLVAFELHP